MRRGWAARSSATTGAASSWRRSWAQIDHPHVIRVHDFEQGGETLLLVMEYAAGGSLAERIAQARQGGGAIPTDDAVRIVREVAEGLAALHAIDIVHRDVKPSNILFDGQGHAKVSDLGLAQVPHGPSQRSLAGSLAVAHPGTPAYMSPEQQGTTGYLAPASDVYGLGVVLFEMLTNRLYDNQRPGTRVRALREGVPEWLDDLLARMLADAPRDRPWDGAELAEALDEGQPEAREAETAREAELKRRQAEAERQAEVKRQREEADAAARRAAEAAKQQPAWQKIGIEMISIPAGESLYGENKEKVTLPAYSLAKTSVTNAQYGAFVAATGRGRRVTGRAGIFLKGKENHPVVNVSLGDAEAFCAWAGLRLPGSRSGRRERGGRTGGSTRGVRGRRVAATVWRRGG